MGDRLPEREGSVGGGQKRTGGDPEEPLGRAIFEATIPCFTHDFGMSRDYYDTLATWLVDSKQAAEIPGLESCWTNHLVY